jgi:hypothetical protein
MDSNRITQILQDLVTEENNRLAKLNEFLQEAINNPGPNITTAQHEALQNRIIELEDQNSHLQGEIGRLQAECERISTELAEENLDDEARTNAEIDALRALSDSLRTSRDNLQTIVDSNEVRIQELQSQIIAKQINLDSTNETVSNLQAQVTELNNKVSELLGEVNAKQLKIEELSDTTDEVKAALDVAKSKIKSEMEEALAEIEGALDDLSKETPSSSPEKNGPHSDGFYKDGKIDTTFSTPFTSIQSGPDVFEITNPLLALDDNLYYSYTNGIAKPYGSQIVFFLPDGMPQTMDNGNWGPNYLPQTPLPMQANDSKWYCFPGGSVVPVEDSETPIAIQKIGPRAGDYEVYYTFKDGVGTVADGVYSNGTFSNGLLQ